MTKVMFDLNVLLDVIQRRKPHFTASAAVCAMAVKKDVVGFVPVHAITTIAYIVRREAGARKEAETLDWLLANFEIASGGAKEMLRARSCGLPDFEDAVVASLAESNGCRVILSRNVSDFESAVVAAMTPEEFLAGQFDIAGAG